MYDTYPVKYPTRTWSADWNGEIWVERRCFGRRWTKQRYDCCGYLEQPHNRSPESKGCSIVAARSNSWNTEDTYRGDLKTRQRYYGGATKRTRVPDTCVLLFYLSSGLSNRIVSWPIVGTGAGFLCVVGHHQSSPYKFRWRLMKRAGFSFTFSTATRYRVTRTKIRFLGDDVRETVRFAHPATRR